MKVVFMGTPDFAAGILEAIIESDHEVVGVVTQEDKPRGRSDKLIPPPVKEVALKYGIDIFQPARIKNEEAVSRLREYGADIFVVAAYGKILSKEILEIPRYGCINTHASLLPKYRGAAPIQWAIADGEKETGVSIMQMDEGLDTGDILYVGKVDITSEETGESLFNKLEETGKTLIVEALNRIEQGDINPVKQDESLATYAKILDKKMGEIDFAGGADEIERLIRAFTPWPGTYTHLKGKVFKILSAQVAGKDELTLSCRDSAADAGAGCIAGVSDDAIYIGTGKDYLKVREVQLEGKKRMSVHDFLMGNPLKVRERLV
ncbi:MAG: methionyl-tRNA formyltransferase [Lachnospiraceae bacterium]|nr:methionyl-tRNA formyltransferase [Lachnospiraceae bacterium]